MCLELLCCCLGPSACGVCCFPTESSLTTKIMYFGFLVTVVVVSSVILTPQIGSAVKNSFLCQFTIEVPTVSAEVGPTELTSPSRTLYNYSRAELCAEIFGYTTVYRICMAVALFFFVMMIVMLCVFSSKDPRAYLQNGFWGIKWLVVIGTVGGFFFIPRDHLIFSKVSLLVGMIGAFIFILLQVIFLVEFAHSWAEAWLEKQRETENWCWYIARLIPTILFYVTAVTGVILMFVFFVKPGGCSLNISFLCSIIALSIIVSITAILPWVQQAQPTGGLLQASIVTLYATYLTYSALSNEPYGPDRNCNLVNSTVDNVFGNDSNEIAASAIGIVILLVTMAYASIYLSNNKQIQKHCGNHVDDSETALLSNHGQQYDDDDDDGTCLKVTDNEGEGVTYSYSFFHFLMMVSTLFVMMQLTNWYNPAVAELDRFQNTWVSVWIKMASAWLCFAIYLWTLVAPLILPNRDFGYGHVLQYFALIVLILSCLGKLIFI